MKRLVTGIIVLSVITLINFWFYIAFKPSDVILNRLFSLVLDHAGRDFTPDNSFEYVFYNSFGDFLAVIMMLIGLSILMRLIRFTPRIYLYRLTLLVFLLFETLQLWMPGNFKIVDLIAYLFAYYLGMKFIAWLDHKPLKGYW